jgi:WD40 repeat protein
LPWAALIFAVGLIRTLTAQPPGPAPVDSGTHRTRSYQARSTWLFVQTRPPGAAIELDGEWLGTSDDLFLVPPGSYTITVELAGHQPRQEPIEVHEQRITRFVVILQRLPEEGSADAFARAMAAPTPPMVVQPRLSYRILSDPWGRVAPADEPPAAAILEGHAGPVNGVEFSPDGRILASAGADNTVRLWSIPSGRPRHVLPVHDSRLGVYSVAFSPDGKRLASCAGRIVRLWDPETGKLLLASRDLGHARSAAFWGDGETLAVDTGGDTVTLCDAGSLEVRNRRTKPRTEVLLLGHDDSVRRIAYSSDRGLVAFAGGWHPQAPGRLTIWDTRATRLVTSFETSSGCVRGVAFSDDAKLLAYAVGSSIRLVDMARLPKPRATR